jgi:hypothetical protein
MCLVEDSESKAVGFVICEELLNRIIQKSFFLRTTSNLNKAIEYAKKDNRTTTAIGEFFYYESYTGLVVK